MRIIIYFLFFCVPIMTFTNSLFANTSVQLQEYLLSLDAPGVKIDPIRVDQFLHEGADLNFNLLTGGNSLQIAVESWAYISGSSDTQNLKNFYTVIEQFLKEGADVNSMDWRGLTPLYTVLRYSRPGENLDQMLELLLSYNPDINKVSGQGLGLTQLLSIGSNSKVLFRFLDMGLKLTAIADNGIGFSHIAARRKPKTGDDLLLKTLFERLPKKSRSEYSSLRAENGYTPIHFAAQAGNLAAVKYLVEELQVAFDEEAKNGATPIELASFLGKTSVVEYLNTLGAKIREKHTSISCRKENRVTVDYEFLVKLIDVCNIKTIKNLLRLLPKSYRSNYTLAYYTNAVQDASYSYPQVVIYGRDAKLLMAFNGHSGQRGYKNLEIIQFRDDTQTFEFRDIKFPKVPLWWSKVEMSEANPAKCISCHGAKPRPLWDAWTFWPGKYNGEMESIFPKEKEFYSQFLKNKNKGRYKHLMPEDSGPIQTIFGKTANLGFNRNIKLDALLDGLMAKKVANEIAQSKKLHAFRYAILGALSCGDIESFIPPSVLKKLPFALEFLKNDTEIKTLREMETRLTTLSTLLGGSPQGRYVLQNKLFGNRYPNQSGNNFDIERTAQLRFVVENSGYSDMSTWFTPFNNGLESYSIASLSSYEGVVWMSLLDPVLDKNLYELFSAEYSKKTPAILIQNLFYQQPQGDAVCKILKATSLSELSL